MESSDRMREWRRQVVVGYETPGEVDRWTRSLQAGWTAAERRLTGRMLQGPGRVLVVGSGGGRELVALRSMGHEGVGIEISRGLVLGFRHEAPSLGDCVVLADMARLPFAPGSFGAVLMFNQVLGHAASRADRVSALAEALRVLRPGGAVLMSFYSGAVEDYSLWLGAWSIANRRRRISGAPASLPGVPRPSRQRGLQRRIRAWVRGKSDRARRFVRGLVDRGARGEGQGDDVLLAPSGTGAGTGRRVPFHLYRFEEFVEDVRRAGGRILLWRSNTELNAGADAPAFFRGLDHLHFCALVPASADAPR